MKISAEKIRALIEAELERISQSSRLELPHTYLDSLIAVYNELLAEEAKTPERPGWDEYFLGIAQAVSARADCTRRRVGAVIVGEDHRVIEVGYNGAPSGEPGCLTEGACPRGAHFYAGSMGVGWPEWSDVKQTDWCHCGESWPCAKAVEPSSSYDTGPGACISVHAEANAVVLAGRRARGGAIYVTDWPCGGCMKLIKAVGIVRVVSPTEEWSKE